jgi:hypothetical protein
MQYQGFRYCKNSSLLFNLPSDSEKVETDVSVISKDLLIKFDNPFPQGLYKRLENNKNRYGGIWKAGLLLHIGYYSYPINIISNIFP